MIKDFNINKLNFEKSLLNITVNPVKIDKFKGFHQFVENKLKEEEKDREDKDKFKSKLKTMISMRRIGSMENGVSSREHSPVAGSLLKSSESVGFSA